MSCTNQTTICIPEDTGPVLLARVTLNTGDYITADDFGTITYVVSKGGTEIDSDSLTVGDVVEDTLVTDDDRWTEDTTGYNFIWDAPYTLFADQGTFKVVVTFTPASGNPVKAIWYVVVEGV